MEITYDGRTIATLPDDYMQQLRDSLSVFDGLPETPWTLWRTPAAEIITSAEKETRKAAWYAADCPPATCASATVWKRLSA